MDYLYDPDDVKQAMESRPQLASRLAQISDKSVPSIAFADARKSPREVLRILTRRHSYPRLSGLLDALEECLAGGWQPDTLLNASDAKNWDAGVSEVCTANHLRLHGFSIGLPGQLGAARRPDIVALRDGRRFAVEVYCPRVWDGFECLFEDIRLAIEHLDVAWDYDFEIACPRPLGSWSHFDPWKLSNDAEFVGRRRALVVALVADVEAALGEWTGGEASVCASRDFFGSDVVVTLSQLRKSTYRLPQRVGSIGPPGLTGFTPEQIFDDVVRKGVVRKLEDAQAVTVDGATPVLFVDIRQTQCWPWWDDRDRQRQFVASIEARIAPKIVGRGVVAFGVASCEPVPAIYEVVAVSEAAVPMNIVASLFGPLGVPVSAQDST